MVIDMSHGLARTQCYEARDAFYECEDRGAYAQLAANCNFCRRRHVDSEATAGVPAGGSEKDCIEARKLFESKCMASWVRVDLGCWPHTECPSIQVKHFDERRAMARSKQALLASHKKGSS